VKDHRRNWVEVRYLSSSDIFKIWPLAKDKSFLLHKDIWSLIIIDVRFSLVLGLGKPAYVRLSRFLTFCA